MEVVDVPMGRPNQASPLRVLVADDHDDSRLLIQTFLSLLGFVVRSVPDGREALREAPLFRPDVVFLDIWMPGMSGVETCMRLRQGLSFAHSHLWSDSGLEACREPEWLFRWGAVQAGGSGSAGRRDPGEPDPRNEAAAVASLRFIQCARRARAV